MDLKFYLNKFAKIDSIEGYTLKALTEIRDRYEEYLEKTEGQDPDFPMITFGGKNGKGVRIKGVNASSLEEENGGQKSSQIKELL